MQRFEINTKTLGELSKKDIPVFKEFMKKEFEAYIVDDKFILAHNEEDSHWFTQQYLEAKQGKGIYQDFFAKTN